MNIGGLLTRSFGTGTTAFNQGERDALTRMRDRQAFVDEEEARRRRAETEALAMGAIRKDYTAPIPEMSGLNPDTQAYKGAAALASMYGARAPVAGVAPAGASPAGAGAAPAAPVSTILETGPTAVDQIRTNTRLGVVGERNTVNSQIQKLDQDIKKLELDIAKNQIGYDYAGNQIQFAPRKEQQRELAKLVKTRDAWVSRSKELDKTLSAGPGVAAPAAAPAAASRTQRPVATTSEEAIKNVLGREGGYVNNPADRGGETKFGISKGSYPNLDIANLTKEEAAAIYKRDYWDGMNIDQLPPEMREVVFDAAVNQGKDFASKALQQSGMDPAKFLALREQRYRDIVARDPSQAQFTGWFNRVNEFKGVTTQLGATSAAASNAYIPEKAKPDDYRNAVPRVDFELRVKSDERAELQRQADEAQSRGLPELYTQAVSQLRQLDMELVHLQGMLGLGDLVDNPEATRRLSIVRSHYMGQKEGYYRLMPRSDGKYNEVVNGKTTKQGLTPQEVIDTNRMIFDKSYAAAVNATRAKQAEAAIELDAKTKGLAFEYGLKLTQALAEKEADYITEKLKGNNAFQQAIEVERIRNQGKEPEVKLFNTASGITVGSVGNQMFKIIQEQDRDGNLTVGSEFLTPLPRS